MKYCRFCEVELEEKIHEFNNQFKPNNNWDIDLDIRDIDICKDCIKTMFKFAISESDIE